ncbi:MAG: hypothetical protein P9E88_14370 [Candidatus Competibacter sp.]|nr:hypothetical protein [Candidatus Competibacter sp.]
MTENTLKITVGLSVVISYFVLIILVIVLYALGGFLFEEMTTTTALIVPMFGAYTSAIIKYILANRAMAEDKSTVVTKAFLFISFFLPFILIAGLCSIILLKAYNIAFSNFDQFKLTLGVLQTAFGVYMGLLLTTLFDIKGKAR